MPLQGQAEFGALLQAILDEPGDGPEGQARALETIIESARRLNEVTTRLTPGPWTPLG